MCLLCFSPLSDNNENDSQDPTYRTSVTNAHYHDELSPDGDSYDPMAQRVEYDNPALNLGEDPVGAPDLGPGIINNRSRPPSSRGSSRSSRSTPFIPGPVPLPRHSRDDPTYDNRYTDEQDHDPDESIPVYSYGNQQPTKIKLPFPPPEDAPPPPPTTAPPPLRHPYDSSSSGSTDTIRRAIPVGRPYDNPSVISSIDDSDLDSSMISEDTPMGYRQYPGQWRAEPDYPYQPRYELGEDQTLV